MLTYAKLRGRIVEKYGSQSNFAKEIGISEVALSRKLKCTIGLSQKDILEWAKVLEIDKDDYGAYFFT